MQLQSRYRTMASGIAIRRYLLTGLALLLALSMSARPVRPLYSKEESLLLIRMDSLYGQKLFDEVISTGRFIMKSQMLISEDFSIPLKLYYSYRHKPKPNLDSAFYFLNKSIDLGLSLSGGADIKWFLTFDPDRNDRISRRFGEQQAPVIDSALLQRITLLWEKGQAWRTLPDAYLDSLKKEKRYDSFMADAIATDAENTNELRKIIHRYGWPGYALVGPTGDTYAWNIAQHADNDIAFQLLVLDLLRSNVLLHNSSPRNYAYLYDRICSNTEVPQLYGTQFSSTTYDETSKAYKITLYPLAEPDAVSIYRAAVKLNPLADYLEASNRHLKEENKK